MGTAQYCAPKYFLGEKGTERSDLFSLGVIAYQMLTGKLPYGTQVAKINSKSDQNKLSYHSIRYARPDVPTWVDDTIMKAVHPNPSKRHEALSEFIFDNKQPNQALVNRTRPPLIECNPVAFWQGISCILCVVIIVLLIRLQ